LTYSRQANGKLAEIYEQTVAVTRARAEQDANAIIKALLARVEAEVRETVRREVSVPVEKSLEDLALRGSRWLQFATCLASGALGAAITLALFQHYPTDSTTQKYGAAVEKVMTRLPPASQKLIKDAANLD
jgi:predicted 2-oxoglutarate/Fe(II)-dependent dioxygenase YbiX